MINECQHSLLVRHGNHQAYACANQAVCGRNELIGFHFVCGECRLIFCMNCVNVAPSHQRSWENAQVHWHCFACRLWWNYTGDVEEHAIPVAFQRLGFREATVADLRCARRPVEFVIPKGHHEQEEVRGLPFLPADWSG